MAVACHSGFLLNIFNSALEFDAASVDTMGRWFETGEMRTLSFAVVGNPHPWVRPCAAWRLFRGFRGLTGAGLLCRPRSPWLRTRPPLARRPEAEAGAWRAAWRCLGGWWWVAWRWPRCASGGCEAAHN